MTQDEAYEILMGADNCFLTGQAGTGKSWVINRLIDDIQDHVDLGVTATTGIAARNIRGSTIHSWMGIGLGRKRDEDGHMEDFEAFWRRCQYSPWFNRRVIADCECLIIEEVSMLTGTFLGDVEKILQNVKGNVLPFGGVKVIFLGDFLQLPPVTRASAYDWAFKSRAWKSAGIKTLNLERSYRQTDPAWITALNDLRMATISRETEELLEGRAVQDYPVGFKGTFLMTHNAQVTAYNLERLAELEGTEKQFRAITTGKRDKVDKILATITIPEVLRLKKGAKVVATINDREKAFYNGSMGEVVSWAPDYITVLFYDSDSIEMVHRFTFDDANRNTRGSKPTATVQQFPLKLAWACTIHSSQGMTLSEVFVEASNIFTAHQLYVAASRCRTIEGLSIKGFDKSKCYVDYDARKFYRDLELQTI